MCTKLVEQTMGIELSYAVSKLQSLSTSDHSSVVSMNLFVALLCACIVIGHLLEENRWVNESITALVIVSFIEILAFELVIMLVKALVELVMQVFNLNFLFCFFFFLVLCCIGCRVCVLELLFCSWAGGKARIF